jgi:hypothetical protein
MFSPTSKFEHAATTVTETEVWKRHSNAEQFEVEVRLLGLAHAGGCAPEFSTEGTTIRFQRLARLEDRLSSLSDPEKAAIAVEVFRCVRRLHATGVCHRDLKLGEVLLGKNGEVLFVDFELGAEVDGNGPCYDLLGPASGVPVPVIHLQIGLLDGVWWDSPTPMVRPLWQDLGHLVDIEPPPGRISGEAG